MNKLEWREEYFAGRSDYALYMNGSKVMFTGYSVQDGKFKLDYDPTPVNSHAEARAFILKKNSIEA